MSLLKKIKRKAEYGDDTDTAETTHATHAMKKLHIDSSTEEECTGKESRQIQPG